MCGEVCSSSQADCNTLTMNSSTFHRIKMLVCCCFCKKFGSSCFLYEYLFFERTKFPLPPFHMQIDNIHFTPSLAPTTPIILSYISHPCVWDPQCPYHNFIPMSYTQLQISLGHRRFPSRFGLASLSLHHTDLNRFFFLLICRGVVSAESMKLIILLGAVIPPLVH